MFRVLSVLFLVVAACSGTPNVSPRILGGTDADIANFPYMASIEQLDQFICGATILSVDWVLTDAFCSYVFDITEYAVRVGSSIARVNSDDVVDTGTLHNVVEWIEHPSADFINQWYDFALVKVDTPFAFTSNVAAIVLPTPGQGTPEGAVGVVTGWGTTSPDEFFSPVSQLHQASVTLVSDDTCTSAHNAQTLCAKGVNGDEAFCWFDEAGPLVVDGTLFGTSLWTQWCTNPQDLQIFGKVSIIRDWINETISI